MYKKLTILVLVLFMLMTTPLWAVEEITIDPQASSVFLSYGSSIAKNGDSITCTAFSHLINDYSQSISMNLQRYENGSWVTLQSWYGSRYDVTLTVGGGYPLSPGLYRVKSTHKAGGETRTSYSGDHQM
jgi:hypothetical protein